MPIYEYECKKCHNHFELMLKMNDHSPQICTQCHSSEVERVVSSAGFQLKGSGWYVTDFKNQTPKPSTNCGKPECGTNKTCDSKKQD